jgi:hypothetical protein
MRSGSRLCMFLDSNRVSFPLAGAHRTALNSARSAASVHFRTLNSAELSISIASRSRCFIREYSEQEDGASTAHSTSSPCRTGSPQPNIRNAISTHEELCPLDTPIFTLSYLPDQRNSYGHDKQVPQISGQQYPNEPSSRTCILEEKISVRGDRPKCSYRGRESSAPRSEILCRGLKYYW